MQPIRISRLRKSLPSITVLFVFAFFTLSVSHSYAVSEFLLKATADTNYKKLIRCIKGNNNDISVCISEFAVYLKSEIALVKASSNKEKYKSRLDKMVNYLKKSTDIFFEKAKTNTNNSLAYYEKASRCASLLMKLSDKYKDYDKVKIAHIKQKKIVKAEIFSGTLHRKLIKCIKGNNNDISFCISEFAAYHKSEIALIKASSNKEEFKSRLDKMVNDLKKSTDIFFEIAKADYSLAYYEKASRCASLLMKLSDEYKDYYIKQKKTVKAQILLGALTRKVKRLKYPEVDFTGSFITLAGDSLKGYEYIDKKLQSEITGLGQLVVSEFNNYLASTTKILAERNLPDYSNFGNRYTAYKSAVKIPRVDSREGKILDLQKMISIQTGDIYKQMKSLQENLTAAFLKDKYKVINKNAGALSTVTSIFVMSNDANTTSGFFIDFPATSEPEIRRGKELSDFLVLVDKAYTSKKSGTDIDSIHNMNKALLLTNLDSNLLSKLQNERNSMLKDVVPRSLKYAKRQMKKKKYVESFNMMIKLQPLWDSFNQNQRIKIMNFNYKLAEKLLKRIGRLRKKSSIGRISGKEAEELQRLQILAINIFDLHISVDQITSLSNLLKRINYELEPL